MSAIVAFVRLSRLKFLAGGFVGGALGTAIAFYERGSISLVAYVLAQCTITAAHLMTQLANEYYDLESDALTTRTKFSGGSGVLVSGELSPRVALGGALACAVANMCGVAALIVTGHELAALFGALCALFAWAYSAPPLRLLARGLGEIDTSLVVAVFVPLCAYCAQTGALDTLAILATLPGSTAMFAMMVSVQVPDFAADVATGKRNLVVRLGLRTSATIAIVATAATIAAVAIVAANGAPPLYAVAQVIAVGCVVWLALGLIRLQAGKTVSPEGLARRGVLAFLLVGVAGALAFASGGAIR